VAAGATPTYQVAPQSQPMGSMVRTVAAGATPTYQAAPQTLNASTVRTVAAAPSQTLTASTVRTVAAAPKTMATSPQVIRSVQAPTIRTVAPAGQPMIRTVAPTSSIGPSTITTTTPNTIAGPGLTKGAYEEKHQDDPQLQNLKELRRTSGLKEVPVSDGLKALKSCAVDDKLTREQFVDAYVQLLQANNVEVPPQSVQDAVFDLFDRDDNNIVDMMELICGISLLCSGTEDDKIHAIFDIFDENGDGFISMDEMFKFLTSVFKVVLTPQVMGVMNSMGVTVESAEDLASVTALECFKSADLNHDGKLSVEEFKNWFYAPRNDPSFLFSPVRKLLQ